MGAIYAELHVGGHVFVLRRCTYGVRQATGPRGRPIEQVRHLAIDGEMEVPRVQFLEKWAATGFMPVDGHIMFSGGPGEPAIETVSWTAGQCVLYREVFNKGSITDGSYICQWRIVAAKLVFSVGPPAPFVAAAAREHGTPPVAAVGSGQKLPIVPLADGIGSAEWQGIRELPSWTEEHKAARWAEYQRDHAGDAKSYTQARWDKQYETNRNNNYYGLKREREYAAAMGATSKMLKTQYTLRQVDMYIENKDADTLYCGQLKTGFVYLTKQAKMDLKRDKWLVDNGGQVEYILEKGGSKPLLGAILKAGATYKVGPQIP